jgi:hypothetical protein
MNYQVWVSKKTNNGAMSLELGHFSPDQCKANYSDWVNEFTAEGFEQLILNPVGIDRTTEKKIVIKL